MTRSSVSIVSITCIAWLWVRTCGAQFAFTSGGSAVASAGGLTVVAQVPGFGALNGIFNNNNNFYPQQQRQQQGGGGWPGMGMGGPHHRGHGHGMGGRGPPQSPNRQPAPPGWPPGWEWGGGGNHNQPGFNNGGGRGPPPRREWGGGPGPMNPPPRPGWGGGGMGPPPRPGWGGGGMGPPPRPGWDGGGMGPPQRPAWGGEGMNPEWGGEGGGLNPGWGGEGGGMNPPTGPGWDNNSSNNYQPDPSDPFTNWNNPNGGESPTPPPPIVTSPTTPKPSEVGPTFQPRPPAQTTKSTLIVGTNRPPLGPLQPTAVPLPTARPSPKPSLHSIEDSQQRDVIFPSSSRYIHRPPSQEIHAENIDVRR
ncbi:basic salivary proline-rich protein 3 [Drosophila pseudoobscura]|uniref:Basic salivary proline-rich protein 3 n=1 Tax=Drosophila pseudoobscura pseudoobscura TaxID=46245 RepID=A0A6I8ULZ9_DROPS|nr:basic salivary proline-rich protein 3 [Drosophila pseudoobscura]